MTANLFASARRPLSDLERETIRFMAEYGRPYLDISRAVGRSVGTVSTEIHRLRGVGMVSKSERCLRYGRCGVKRKALAVNA